MLSTVPTRMYAFLDRNRVWFAVVGVLLVAAVVVWWLWPTSLSREELCEDALVNLEEVLAEHPEGPGSEEADAAADAAFNEVRAVCDADQLRSAEALLSVWLPTDLDSSAPSGEAVEEGSGSED